VEKNKMTNQEIKNYKRVLEAKRKELLPTSADREEIQIEKAADEFDQLQLAMNRELAICNLDREASLLRSVEAALGRIKNGHFGTCLLCEEDIPEKRLKALPWAAYCVPCQELLDQQKADGQINEEHEEAFAAA
jgi:DnaK suppressor protein